MRYVKAIWRYAVRQWYVMVDMVWWYGTPVFIVWQLLWFCMVWSYGMVYKALRVAGGSARYVRSRGNETGQTVQTIKCKQATSKCQER